MAAVSAIESLSEALVKINSLSGSHVWLDDKDGLVIGTFPVVHSRFDFAVERFVTTQPEKSETKRTISLLGEAKRVVQIYEIETADAVYRVGSATQLLIQSLNIIEEKFPGTLEKLSGRKKQSKRPVARSRADLYDVPHPDAHSTRLKSGYFVATNNKAFESRGVVREAAELAGLSWGNTFKVRRV